VSIVRTVICSARQCNRAPLAVTKLLVTTDLKLDDPGTLPKPGPIGRIIRFALGILCVWYVKGLVDISDNLIAGDGHIRAVVWNGIIPGMFLVSYIINIGFSRAWGKRPAIVSAALVIAGAGIGHLLQRSIETELLARTIWVWEMYLFSHLGLAFLIAGVIGTPGCEMRAFHHLYSRITGVPTKEHFCPVGPLHPIDQWEARRSSKPSV